MPNNPLHKQEKTKTEIKAYQKKSISKKWVEMCIVLQDKISRI